MKKYADFIINLAVEAAIAFSLAALLFYVISVSFVETVFVYQGF